MKKFLVFVLVCLIIASGIAIWYRIARLSQTAAVFLTEHRYSVELFYPNGKKDPKKEACQYVYGVKRTIDASRANLVLKTIQEMLKGPTAEEKAEGYYNAFPDSKELVFFNVEGNRAEIFVDYPPRQVDTCLKSSLEEQVRQTLLQFSNINEIEMNSLDFVEIVSDVEKEISN